MKPPTPRGAVSAAVVDRLTAGAPLPDDVAATHHGDDDRHLALWTIHEVSYRGFDGVSDSAEWDPELLDLRLCLEAEYERELRARFRMPPVDDVAEDLFSFIESHDGASLARHVEKDATVEEVIDLLRVRSIYHLKEADPTSWTLPRLSARPKAALAALQFDEYGTGDPHRLHHALFARGMSACGLSPDDGAYVDEAPKEVLAQNNAVTMFGLHRRLRGAALGHLAAFEATSSLPSRAMAAGIRRLGMADAMAAYYDEHVEADAVHEQLAVREICQPLVDDEPHLLEDVFFGAFTCLDLEDRVGRTMLARWTDDD